ncbi:MAG: cytidylate kinase-like family protein [Bacteroidetes bacterium]|nr:cytidylate kinase-like family protein [Bacteroidota bacterium]
MENMLREYLERSFSEVEPVKPCGTGPVVTISREFGCPSKPIAQALTETINRLTTAPNQKCWRFINKEIVESAAKELELNPTEINYMISAGAKGILADVLASFTTSYVSNHRMKKTIRKVIGELAQKGRMIIVGRGGVGVLQGCPNAIHVRLQAPLEWRIPEICQLRGINREAAIKLAEDTDQKRKSLIELVYGDKFNPYLFDLSFNCQTLSMKEIVDTIIGLMVTKKMLP